jgi:cation diffusion facilitator CzcD-associated flavoprotein CzcO
MSEERAERGRPLRFAIIGAGMAGILSAIRLREAGFDDFTIYEKADQPGGTWRENTYPGIACDVPSHLYSYSFEPNPDWSHRFSPGDEIQAYFGGVARRHGVTDRIRFGDEVERCEFSEGRWRLVTKGGHRDEVECSTTRTSRTSRVSTPSRAPSSTARAGTTE